MKKRVDILICGVGGQGILLTSNIIGIAGVEEGFSVRGTEIHGMSQRGGSVEAHIRLNCNYGPQIPYGKGDILIGFEPLEVARYSNYLKENGICVVNSYKIPIIGYEYDEKEIIKIIKRKTDKIYIENFTEKSKELGYVRCLNILMLGFASNFIPIKEESFINAINMYVKKEFVKINYLFFKSGRELYHL